MSFKNKEDFYGLSSIAGIELVSTTENKTAQVIEAKGENGFVVASQMLTPKSAPVCEYLIKAHNVNLGTIDLGKVITKSGGKSYCVGNINITTGAGQIPTMSIDGSQVENNAIDSCRTQLSSINVSGLHHAQTFGAFTYSGTGAHLIQCSLQGGCTVLTADKEGEPIAHDIIDGRVTVTGTIQVSDPSYPIPTVTPSDGWTLTQPISESNPNGDFPSYTFGLMSYLSAIAPSN